MMVTAFADAPLLNAQGQRASVADVVVDARAGTLLRVFAECNVCEEDYLRQQLAFVNLVRDRMLADVHVLVTSLPSGGGGEQFSIELTGRVPGAADTTRRSDTVRVTLRADATGIEEFLVYRRLVVVLLDELDLQIARIGQGRGELHIRRLALIGEVFHRDLGGIEPWTHAELDPFLHGRFNVLYHVRDLPHRS